MSGLSCPQLFFFTFEANFNHNSYMKQCNTQTNQMVLIWRLPVISSAGKNSEMMRFFLKINRSMFTSYTINVASNQCTLHLLFEYYIMLLHVLIYNLGDGIFTLNSATHLTAKQGLLSCAFRSTMRFCSSSSLQIDRRKAVDMIVAFG